MEPIRRLKLAIAALISVVAIGTAGYLLLGFGLLDALYQTVTTISTVGFREVQPFNATGKVFTIALVLVGVGTALYTFTVFLESLIEGHLRQEIGRRRMEREIAGFSDHVIVCGWGRVGRAIAAAIAQADQQVLVVDRDPDRLAGLPYPVVLGDVTDDEVLVRAGIGRARVLIAALETDADNVYVTLSGRTLNPALLIVARARTESSEAKLRRAGADRVVNPQQLGGNRMAAFALQPHVADFVDVVMHDRGLEYRLEEVAVAAGSPYEGRTIRQCKIRDTTGALLLAVRGLDGSWATNQAPEFVLESGQVLIAVGTQPQLGALVDAVGH